MNKKYYYILKDELNYLKELRKHLNSQIIKSPKGNLLVRKSKGRYMQCYVNGKYVPKKNIVNVKALAQREYDEKLLKEIDSRIDKVNALVEYYSEDLISHIYNSFSESKQSLISPIEMSDEDYINHWLSATNCEANTFPIQGNIFTEKGEHVRSKSEKIIADKLYKEGVPYIYEPELILNNHRKIYPDFKVLNVRLRTEFYFEHMGMMDNPEYSEKAIEKINTYEKNGFWAGQNILYTFETKDHIPDANILNQMINTYLL